MPPTNRIAPFEVARTRFGNATSAPSYDADAVLAELHRELSSQRFHGMKRDLQPAQVVSLIKTAPAVARARFGNDWHARHPTGPSVNSHHLSCGAVRRHEWLWMALDGTDFTAS